MKRGANIAATLVRDSRTHKEAKPCLTSHRRIDSHNTVHSTCFSMSQPLIVAFTPLVSCSGFTSLPARGRKPLSLPSPSFLLKLHFHVHSSQPLPTPLKESGCDHLCWDSLAPSSFYTHHPPSCSLALPNHATTTLTHSPPTIFFHAMAPQSPNITPAAGPATSVSKTMPATM
jgi:hypothetical protein